MPIRPDEPLRKVTVNLYDSDVIDMQRLYGQGWSTELRRILHYHLLALSKPHRGRTLGDLADD